MILVRCFCCSRPLPIDVSTFYDTATDRFYCHLCDLYIMEYIVSLFDPTLKKEDRIIEDTGEVEILDEDYLDDYYDPYDDYYIDDYDYLHDQSTDIEDQ